MDTLNVSGSASGSNDVVSHSAATTPPVSEPTSNSVAQSPKPPRSDLDLVALSDVAPENVKWLWPGRIPYGKVTILEGDPGLGKSQVTLDLVARVTAGEALPTGESVVQGNVLLLTAEDGLASMQPVVIPLGSMSSMPSLSRTVANGCPDFPRT